MSFELIKLTSPGIRKLEPYQPGKPIEELEREYGIDNIIKLASNENPGGPSPHVVSLLNNELKRIHLYPDSSGYELKQALTQHWQVEPNRITLGNGSDNLLSLAVQAFVEPGCDVIISEYAFSTYAIITQAMRANPKIIPADNWAHDLDAMAKAITDKTKLVFIGNPNNPTGTWLSHQQLNQFLSNIPGNIIVVLDEAYYEYVDHADYPDALALQQNYPNLIITRTFSKIYGLAGMRVGYAITHPTVADILNRVRLPFNVSSLALKAATTALYDIDYVNCSRKLNQQGKAQLEQALQKMGLSYIPSAGNFITIDVTQPAIPVYQALLAKGIIVRPLLPYDMPHHLRITIGLPEQNERLIAALQQI
jgi:histidinol-phosphate aminotransferase